MSSVRADLAPSVLMIGTSPDTQGGVSSVVMEMMASTLFRACRVSYVSTHVDGSALRKLGAAWVGLMRIWLILLVRRPKLLHVHLSSRASFWRKLVAVVPSWALRVPVLVHLHGSEFRVFHEEETGFLGRYLIRQMMVRSAKVVALSGQWKDWLEQQFPGVRAVVIPNSVSLPSQGHDEVSATPILLFMGRLGRRKGTPDLLNAFARLPHLSPSPRLVLAGDGEIAEARGVAEELGVGDRVETPGWVGRADRAALLRRASIYVLPSYNEGLPMSVLEAMAYGLPIVATPVGGIPDAITEGKHGFLVEPGDVEALSARLQQLLKSSELAERMGRASRQRIEQQFATSAVIENWLALYAELGVTLAAPAGTDV